LETLPRHVHRARRVPRWGLIAIITPVALLAAVVLAWGVDTIVGGDAVRNVEVAGRSVGGDTRADVTAVVEAYADDVAVTPVRIETSSATYDATAADLGVGVDVDATVERVLDAGRGFVPARPFSWVASFLSGHEIDPVITVDDAVTSPAVIGLEGADRTLPTEPTFTLGPDGAVALVAGIPGSGLDTAEVAEALPGAVLDAGEAVGADADPIIIAAEPEPVPPAMADAEVQTVVDDANAKTAAPLTVDIEGDTAEIDPATVRTWLRPVPSPEAGPPTLGVDQEAALASLREVLGGVGEGSVDAGFDLVDGQIQIVPSQDGTGCCGADTAHLILTALQSGAGTVSLSLGPAPAAFTTEMAQGYGIAEQIGGTQAWPTSRVGEVGPGFTTFHAAGESRVTNIHRIADLVRGAVIPPGGQFSVNGHVGRRTTANGFVEAGAIRNGEHVSEVGGGVSQFATTLFNAAYFAGLDITTYQAHSEYFSRYPRGREATMGFPNPDLVIQNNTPYGVLIWTSYTGSSLTVTMYSTPFATGEQTGISEGSSGNCRVVTTTRTRTFVDGREPVTDQFRATYRPGEGQFC
jgi:vancomycin resistance protein YoaR